MSNEYNGGSNGLGALIARVAGNERSFSDFTKTVDDSFKGLREGLTDLGKTIAENQRRDSEQRQRELEASKTPGWAIIAGVVGIVSCGYGGVQLLTSHEESIFRPIIADIQRIEGKVNSSAPKETVDTIQKDMKAFVPRDEVRLAMTDAEKERIEIKRELRDLSANSILRPEFQSEVRRLEEESKMRNETLKERVNELKADFKEVRTALVSRQEIDTRDAFMSKRLDLISTRVDDLRKEAATTAQARSNSLEARDSTMISDQIKALQSQVEQLRQQIASTALARQAAEEFQKKDNR